VNLDGISQKRRQSKTLKEKEKKVNIARTQNKETWRSQRARQMSNHISTVLLSSWHTAKMHSSVLFVVDTALTLSSGQSEVSENGTCFF